jgi:hypothetical protein
VLCKTAVRHGVAEFLPWSMKVAVSEVGEEGAERVEGQGDGRGR